MVRRIIDGGNEIKKKNTMSLIKAAFVLREPD